MLIVSGWGVEIYQDFSIYNVNVKLCMVTLTVSLPVFMLPFEVTAEMGTRVCDSDSSRT